MILSAEVSMETIVCSECGGVCALTANFVRKRREEGGSWRCPYCPSDQCFRESEVKRLKRQLEDEQKRLAAERARHDQTRADRDHLGRQLSATKGVVTRTKNRISKGVCPCCNRTFQDLQRHMASKHPDYAEPTP